MRQGIARIVLLAVGMVLGSIGTIGLWYLKHDSTQVWTADVDLISDNGITIPQGTQLILDTWMPEGFARLKLYINIEGSTLGTFKKATESEFNLVIPYAAVEDK